MRLPSGKNIPSSGQSDLIDDPLLLNVNSEPNTFSYENVSENVEKLSIKNGRCSESPVHVLVEIAHSWLGNKTVFL